MVPEIWVYRAADKLIAQHGSEAVEEATKLIATAIEGRQDERALLMMRVRLAIKALQTPPSKLLH